MNSTLNRCRRLRLLPGGIPAILMLLSLAALSYPAQAQTSRGADPDDWQFTVAPYAMVPWMNGTTALRGREAEVDVSPSQIFDNLQFSVMGYFEARKSGWGVAVDAVYMGLGATVDQAQIQGERAGADVDFDQGAYTFMVLRQVNSKVDFLAGARWNILNGRLGFKGPQESVFEDDKQFVDPIIGLKVKQSLGGPVHFTMEGDIGGFGVGSDFAWQLFPVLGVDVNKHFTLTGGYRVMSMDYKTGNEGEQFKWDVVTQAIVMGAAFHF